MKNALLYFFASLGVVFSFVLIGLAYFYVTDPYNLKPLFFGSGAMPVAQDQEYRDNGSTDVSSNTETGTSSVQASGGFTLSSAQKQALIDLSIDPASVPTNVSPEQERCFVGVLGEARVGEIKAGAVPSAMEFFRAKACVQ
jgi:hypothetical protein